MKSFINELGKPDFPWMKRTKQSGRGWRIELNIYMNPAYMPRYSSRWSVDHNVTFVDILQCILEYRCNWWFFVDLMFQKERYVMTIYILISKTRKKKKTRQYSQSAIIPYHKVFIDLSCYINLKKKEDLLIFCDPGH